MQPETQNLCRCFRSLVIQKSTTNAECELQFSLVFGTTHITIDEVENTNPAEITVTVGTTRSWAAVDPLSVLPEPTSERYLASHSRDVWLDRYGNSWSPSELAAAWAEVFSEYIGAAA